MTQNGFTFGARLRFRTTKGLRTPTATITFQVDGHAVTLASTDGKQLREGGWYSLTASGFKDWSEAKGFGDRLRTALQIASIRRMLGVDVGSGRATSSLGPAFYDHLAEQGRFVRPNIHGLDVFEDRPGTTWHNGSLGGSVSTNAAGIVDDLAMLAGKVSSEEPAKFNAIRLLNEALVAVEASAKLTLAIAAVEMLAQGEKWKVAQKKAIKRLLQTLESDDTLSPEEREELAIAVKRIYKAGVMLGFRRLLDRLKLNELWELWSELYSDRSRILHGLAYAAPEERAGMVAPAILLSARIVLTALDTEIPGAASNLDPILHLPQIYVKFDADLMALNDCHKGAN